MKASRVSVTPGLPSPALSGSLLSLKEQSLVERPSLLEFKLHEKQDCMPFTSGKLFNT